MCGVIGFVDKKEILSSEEKYSLAQKMLEKINHRGYDSQGIYVDQNVVLGHNRLAILDISKKASQPFVNKNKTIAFSYNGEIFNHKELRKITQNKKYNSTSDTETLMHLFEEYGNNTYKLLRGMFAVSFYEKNTKKITLAVDSFGIKPLYYINTPDWFAWSSEIKALSLIPNLKFSFNHNSLFEYGVFRTISNSETMITCVKKMLPGEYLIYKIENNLISKKNYIPKKYTSQKIQDVLPMALSEHLISDVEIGLQLSGGVDSSLISLLASHKLTQGKVHSFSIGLKDPKWNEFKYSRQVSKLIKSKHHEIIFTEKEFCRLLPFVTYHLDEPISYPNTVAMMILSKKARKYVKVLLSGEGADEIFGGYTRYKKIFGNLSNYKLLFSNSFVNPKTAKSVFHFDNQSLENRKKIIKKTSHNTSVYKLALYDLKTFLPSLLLRQDKMGMANNLENRMPYLDFRLVNGALALRDNQKITKQETKIFLKEIASLYLPKNIVYRKKCGFGLPISDWLRNSQGLGMYLKMFTNPKIKRSYFKYPSIKQLIYEHVSAKADHSEILWILITLELWTKIFIDKENLSELTVFLKI